MDRGNRTALGEISSVTHLVSDPANRVGEVIADQLIAANQRNHNANENKGVFAICLAAMGSGDRFAEPDV